MARLLAQPTLLVALFAAVAAPAVAQTAVAQQAADGVPAPAAPAIDPALVGQWTLVEVEHHGALDAFGADVEAMACAFGADGEATVGLTVEQDADTYTHQKTFRFVTADGRIVADGSDGATYEMLDDGELRLAMPDGFVARLRRADGQADG